MKITKKDIINAIDIKYFIDFYEKELEENEKNIFYKTITTAIYDCYCDNQNIEIKKEDKVIFIIFMIKENDFVYIKDFITDKTYYQEID
jgi:hypothetical protein